MSSGELKIYQRKSFKCSDCFSKRKFINDVTPIERATNNIEDDKSLPDDSSVVQDNVTSSLDGAEIDDSPLTASFLRSMINDDIMCVARAFQDEVALLESEMAALRNDNAHLRETEVELMRLVEFSCGGISSRADSVSSEGVMQNPLDSG